MIHSITFRRWKSFLDTTLYLDQMMVLIGMNASGKSNVLDALSLLKALADGEDVQTALSRLRGGAELATLYKHDSFELEINIRLGDNIEKEFIYFLKVQTSPYIGISNEKLYFKNDLDIIFEITNKDEVWSEFSVSNGYKVIWPKSSLFIRNSHSFIDQKTSEDIYQISSILSNILVFEPMPSQMRKAYPEISLILENDGSNFAGVIAALDDFERQVVELQLNHYLTRLPEQDIGKVWVEKIGRLGRDAMIYCEETWPNGQTFTIDTRGMSDGTLRFLAILTALLTRPEGSNLIIEEVDNGLHPSRAKLLLEMLREIAVKRNIDVLVTTHNPALLDAMTPDYIGFITVAHRNPQGYSELTLLDELDALPKLLASGGVGYLATTGKLDQAIEAEQEQGE